MGRQLVMLAGWIFVSRLSRGWISFSGLAEMSNFWLAVVTPAQCLRLFCVYIYRKKVGAAVSYHLLLNLPFPPHLLTAS